MTFPISRVIVRAYDSLCFRRISAACDRYAPRSFGASRDHVRNASRASCTFARTSADVAIECVARGLPVAGLITWNVRYFAAARPRAPRLEAGMAGPRTDPTAPPQISLCGRDLGGGDSPVGRLPKEV